MLTIDTTVSSPNYSDRGGTKIEMLVLHATAGRKDSDLAILTDDSVPLRQRVSVHYYILKTGHVYQLVPERYAAWHAGKAYWNAWGPVDIMDNSIGIELENLNNGIDPYPTEQYNACLELSRDIVTRNSIARNNVVTHQMIAGLTEGKTDPKGFPFDKLVSDIYSGSWGQSDSNQRRGRDLPPTSDGPQSTGNDSGSSTVDTTAASIGFNVWGSLFSAIGDLIRRFLNFGASQ